jgi:hypothetical protein
MVNYDNYRDLGHFPPPPDGRWRRKAATFVALCGGVFGAAVAAAVATVPHAGAVLGIAAAVVALLFAVPVVKLVSIFPILRHTPFTRFALAAQAATGGAVVGAFLGMMFAVPGPVFLGGICGWLTAKVSVRGGLLTRLGTQVAGILLGASLGVILAVLQINGRPALPAIAWGLLVGAVIGALPLLGFMRMFDAVAPRPAQKGEDLADGDVIDVPSSEVPEDGNEASP